MRDKSSLLLALNWFSFVTFMLIVVLVAQTMHRRANESTIDFLTRDTVEDVHTTFSRALAELQPPYISTATTLRIVDGRIQTSGAPLPAERMCAISQTWERLQLYVATTQMEAMVHACLATRDPASGALTARDMFDPACPVGADCVRNASSAIGATGGVVRARIDATTRVYCFAMPTILRDDAGAPAWIVCRTVVDIAAQATAHRRASYVLGGLVLVFVLLSVLEFLFLLERYVRPLHASRQMLEAVLDTIPVRVFWKDLNLTYLGCNRRFAQDTGFTSPSDIVGRTDHELVWREFAEVYRADDRAVMDTGVPKMGFEEPYTSKDGRIQWLRTSKVPLRVPSGDIIGVLGTFEDITAEREAKDALLRRLGFEQALARISDRLLDTDNVPGLLETCLGEIAAALQVQASRFFRCVPGADNTRIDIAAQWCENASLDMRDDHVNLRASDIAWTYLHSATDNPLIVNNVDDMPQNVPERATMVRHGARAFLSASIRRSGTVTGIVTAVCFAGTRQWREDETNFFVTAVQIIGGAIERHEIHRDLRRHHDELEQTVRQRTEDLELINDQLRESESLYASTINSLHDWMHVVDRDMRILFANDAFVGAAKRYGFGTDVIGSYLFELMPFLGDHVHNEYLQVFSTGRPVITQDRNMVDGRTVFTETKKTPVFVNGAVDRVVTFIEDITERRMAEQALRESEARFRTLFDSSPFGVAEQDWSVIKHCLDQARATGVTDLDAYFTLHPERVADFWSNFIIRDANPALQHLYGVASSHELMANIDRLYNDEAFDAIRASLLAVACGEQEFETETTLQSLHGSKRYVAMKWRVMPGHETTYGKVVLSFVDITAHTRAEELVRQSERKFSATFQLSPALMAIVTCDRGVFLEVNDAYVRNTGYSREELIGRTADDFDIWNPAQRDEARALIQRDGILANFELLYRARTGNFRTGLLFAEQLDIGGTPCFLTMAIDITERKKAEEQIARFAALVESSNEFIGMADLDGYVTYLNRAGRAMVGFGPDDDVSRTRVTDYVPEERRENLAREVMAAVKSTGLWSGEGVLRNFQTHAPVDVAVATFIVPPATADTQPCIATVMRNISARKRADAQIRAYEQQLRAMASDVLLAEERERRRIAAGLHDDVCQTLALVKMKLAMALPKTRAKKAVGEIAAAIETAIASLRTLMFDLSPPALYELGLCAAIEWLADRVHHQHGIACTFNARTDLGMLDEGTRTILYLATRELVMNVVKHAAARRVTITADIHGSSLCIVVADNGRGMPTGAGHQDSFGLFSVRERLRCLGGTLDIQSQKGRGTTAVITCPPSLAPAEP